MNLKFIIGSLIIFSSFLNAQDSIKFESGFFPNKIYVSENHTNSKSYLYFEGDKDFLEELKEQGLSIPIVSEISTHSISEIETKDEKNDRIPFVLFAKTHSKSANINGTKNIEPNILEDSYWFGYFENRNNMVIDSIQSEKIDEETKILVKNTLETITDGINYPENPLKVGDTFEQNIPMDFPIADLGKISFLMNTKYFLKEIKNDLAFFDTKINFIMTSEIPDIEILSNGAGTGVVEFDIINTFASKVASKFTIEMIIKLNENLKMHINSESESNYSMKIKN